MAEGVRDEVLEALDFPDEAFPERGVLEPKLLLGEWRVFAFPHEKAHQPHANGVESRAH